MSDPQRIAIIPARGGSKRIPRKNIREFCGKPLIAYSIETALNSGLFDHVVVSTEDEEIAEVSRAHGATTPFMRPAELADDFTATMPIIKHAVEWFQTQGQRVGPVCCIYATAPLLQAKYLAEGLNKLDAGWQYAFSVSTFDFPIQRALHRREDGRVDAADAIAIEARSQDLEEMWHDAGQFYWGSAEAFINELPMTTGMAYGIEMPRSLVQDIDTEEDWLEAEIRYRLLKES